MYKRQGAYGSADGTLITPAGVTISAGGTVSYEVEADGDEVFNAGGRVGVGAVSYTHLTLPTSDLV